MKLRIHSGALNKPRSQILREQLMSFMSNHSRDQNGVLPVQFFLFLLLFFSFHFFFFQGGSGQTLQYVSDYHQFLHADAIDCLDRS